MLSSQGLGIVTQTAYFILVARALDAPSYGAFVSVTAITSIIFPFIGLGSANILIKNVAKSENTFQEQWGNTLLISILTGILAILIVLLISPFLFSNSLSLPVIALILIADLIGLRLLENCGSAFVAVFQVKRTAQIKALYNVSKLIAAIILVLCFNKTNLLVWSALYCISSLLPAIVASLVIHYSLGKPKPCIIKFKSELSQGLLFSVDSSASNINSSVDRAMLGSLAGFHVAGIYSAAYRFIDIFYYVIFALSGATYSRFFKHGTSGIKGSFGFAKKLLPIALLYGFITTTAIFFMAPVVVPLLLGKNFLASIEVLKWLAPIHLTSYTQLLAADVLTGSGFQGYRSAIQVTSAALNIGLNLFLIPIFSWKGAACATLISESLKTLGLWLLIAFLYKRADAQTNPDEEAT
jgi:O-antigen/teichoic acid export membrane protein